MALSGDLASRVTDGSLIAAFMPDPVRLAIIL